MKGVINFIYSGRANKMRKINRNLSGIPSRMTDLSGNPSAPTPHTLNLELMKKFETLKGMYNDSLAFEAQALRETDPESKVMFVNLFSIRRNRLYEFIHTLEKDIKDRLHLLVA